MYGDGASTSIEASMLVEFLKAHPHFSFDIEEYLISLGSLQSTQARLSAFQDRMGDHTADQDQQNVILRSIREEFSKSVGKYKDLHDVHSFCDIPFSTKDLIRADPTSFLNRDLLKADLWYKSTSGTSGPPLTVLYDRQFYFDQLLVSPLRTLLRAGISNPAGSRVLCLHITDTQSSSHRVVASPIGKPKLLVNFVVSGNFADTIDELVNFVKAERPVVITSRPELLELLMAHSHERQWQHHPICIVSSGSLLTQERRQRIENFFRTDVFSSYGLTEFGLVASECRHKSGFHVDGTSVFVEVISKEGRPLALGNEGELVISSVQNRAMPLVRYRTGDTGILTTACQCGAAGLVIARLCGRHVPCFRFSSGVLFSPTYFNDLFSRFPITEYQITQTSANTVEVGVEFQTCSRHGTALLSAVRTHVEKSFPVNVVVRIKQERFTPGSKLQRYRSLLPN
jgi:phenylacetate-CoA ligase